MFPLTLFYLFISTEIALDPIEPELISTSQIELKCLVWESDCMIPCKEVVHVSYPKLLAVFVYETIWQTPEHILLSWDHIDK